MTKTSADDSGETPHVPKPSKAGGGRACLEGMLSQLGLPAIWQSFFVMTASGESGFNVNAENNSPGERRASVKAFERNEEALSACGWSPAEYTWGSGGWTGLIPANALMQFDSDRRCLNPREAIHDPKLSLAMSVGFANGLTRWDGFKRDPDMTTLRLGFGWPAKMGNDAEYKAVRRAKYAKRMARVGLPESLLDMEMPRLGISADEAADALESFELPGACS